MVVPFFRTKAPLVIVIVPRFAPPVVVRLTAIILSEELFSTISPSLFALLPPIFNDNGIVIVVELPDAS